MYIPFLLACILTHDAVSAMTNVTVDDSDALILYNPPSDWGVSVVSSLDYNGTHHLSQNSSASAIFTFTGVAVYFLSPKWPYAVTTQLSLDGGPAEVLDLKDYSNPVTAGGPETAAYSTVWGVSGLANTQHRLVASMAPNGQFIVVDGFTYTVPNSTSTTPSPTSPISSSTSSTSLASHGTHHSKLIAPIAGAAAGLLGLLILTALILLCFRRRKHRDPSFLDPSYAHSARGSIGPGSSSFHFSQSGVTSPAPSMITTNLAGYGAYRQQMPPFPEDRNYPMHNYFFAGRSPQMNPSYFGMRSHASDQSIHSQGSGYDARVPREMAASAGSRLSTVVEGSGSSGGGSTVHVQTPSSFSERSIDYGYQGGMHADASTTVIGSRPTSLSSSYQPTTSISKGYAGMGLKRNLDEREYMLDQRTLASSRQQSVSSRVASPGPAHSSSYFARSP